MGLECSVQAVLEFSSGPLRGKARQGKGLRIGQLKGVSGACQVGRGSVVEFYKVKPKLKVLNPYQLRNDNSKNNTNNQIDESIYRHGSSKNSYNQTKHRDVYRLELLDIV